MATNISAVVPTFNTGRILRECLDSLLAQRHPFSEIIMVDDGSTDGTRDVIQEYHARCPEVFKVIMLDSRVERCVGRNTGWRAASGELVVIIEADSVYDKHFVGNVVKCFDGGADAVEVRRAVYNPNSFIARINDDFLEARLLRNRFTPISAWVFKKEVLVDVGGYDEGLVGFEDQDIGRRTRAKGYKLMYTPDALLYHEGEPRTLREEMERAWWFGIRAHKLYKKYPGDIPWARFLLFSGLTFSVMFPAVFFSLLFLILAILFLKFILLEMRPIYAMAETILSLLRYWVFFVAYIISTVDKKKRR